MALGKTLGEIGGAALGSVIPGLGTMAGGAIGEGIGGLLDPSGQKQPPVESPFGMPGAVDPEQSAFLSQLDMKRKGMGTGSEFSAGEREAGQGLASTQEAIAKTTGGDIGATIAGLNRAQRSYGTNVNQLLAEGEKNSAFFTKMSDDMLNRISDRRLQLQLADRSEKLAQWRQNQQDATANKNANDAGAWGSIAGGVESLFGGGASSSGYKMNDQSRVAGMLGSDVASAAPARGLSSIGTPEWGSVPLLPVAEPEMASDSGGSGGLMSDMDQKRKKYTSPETI